jgi:DMSO/TMAO reductase YedYZ molybdopterin-dependent catalytic subunit
MTDFIRRRRSRRDFLRAGAAAGAGLLAGCGWDGGSLLRPFFGVAAAANDVLGGWLHSNSRLAKTYSPGERVGTMPSYFISRTVPILDQPEQWALQVGGLVRTPLLLTLADLQALPRVGYTVKHVCVEGWTAVASWVGVPFSTILAMAQPTPSARFVRFDSFDSKYYNGWDLESATHPQTILAYAFNDRALMPDHGAPVRLYSPIKLGYKLTKYLTKITFTSERPGGYWEDQGYPWLAGI